MNIRRKPFTLLPDQGKNKKNFFKKMMSKEINLVQKTYEKKKIQSEIQEI